MLLLTQWHIIIFIHLYYLSCHFTEYDTHAYAYCSDRHIATGTRPFISFVNRWTVNINYNVNSFIDLCESIVCIAMKPVQARYLDVSIKWRSTRSTHLSSNIPVRLVLRWLIPPRPAAGVTIDSNQAEIHVNKFGRFTVILKLDNEYG
jgi:hypothetical protein